MRSAFIAVILMFSFSVSAQETVSKEYLIGKFRPEKDARFGRIEGHYLRKEAIEGFLKMKAAAKKAGIHLQVFSATRTFSYQKQIWNAKWNGNLAVDSDTNEYLPKPNSNRNRLTPTQRALRILEFSSMPTTSRHHWGSDVDINNIDPSYWESGRGSREFLWLRENASKFGFCQPFTENRDHGYKVEKWHWSYLPLSKSFLLQFRNSISNKEIVEAGFDGAETAAAIDIVKNYVLGINPDCR